MDTQSDGLLQGPLKIMPVNEILGKTSFMTTFTSFPGPLKNASKVRVTVRLRPLLRWRHC